MRTLRHNTMGWLLSGAAALAMTPGLVGAQGVAVAPKGDASQTPTQQDGQQAGTAGAVPSSVAPQGSGVAQGVAPVVPQGVVLDRVVAVVNGDIILESDVDEERRFEEIQPYRRREIDKSREMMMERLIDRTLILQQSALEPEDVVSDKDLDDQLKMLRKDIPDCKQRYPCETDEGWKRFLGDHGFTVEEFRERWRQRMLLLKFIEVRFRNGVKITDAEIKDFYENRMLPEYEKRAVAAPKMDTISKRIEEVLLQQQVGTLLVDWLKSLRVQGSVKIMTPGEVTP